MQIFGGKKVTLIPALQISYLYNDKGVFSEIYNPDDPVERDRFNFLEKTSKLEYIINPGEIIFITVEWWYYVESLDVPIGLTLENIGGINVF